MGYIGLDLANGRDQTAVYLANGTASATMTLSVDDMAWERLHSFVMRELERARHAARMTTIRRMVDDISQKFDALRAKHQRYGWFRDFERRALHQRPAYAAPFPTRTRRGPARGDAAQAACHKRRRFLQSLRVV